MAKSGGNPFDGPAVPRSRLTWAVALLLVLAYGLPYCGPIFSLWFPSQERPVYLLEPFSDLLWQHLWLVVVSSSVSVLLGVSTGIAATRPAGRAFRPLLETLASMGQTIPPIAVLALAVPIVGFGDPPALIALALFGVLPVLQATMAGLESVPRAVEESALGMGMGPWQLLWQVQVPLALPLWLTGVRTSVIINTGTAAIASTVGAKTLGAPIIVGLSGFNTAYVLQGAILVGLLALTIDMAFELLMRRIQWNA